MKILFISHEASRSGAPIILLELIRWLKENSDFSIDVLLLNSGDMVDEFLKLDNIHSLAPLKTPSFVKRASDKLKGTISQKSDSLKIPKTLCDKSFDVIYGNTIVSLEMALKLKNTQPGAKVVIHVHELKNVILNHLKLNRLEGLLEIPDHFIACSQLVMNELNGSFGITDERITLIHEFIQQPPVKPTGESDVSKRLGVDEKTFLVGACGTPGWRKGTDIFLFVIKAYCQKHPNDHVKFCWLGDSNDGAVLDGLRIDLENLGLSDKVMLPGKSSQPFDYFRNFDVFLMLSREDPFPLVCIENALIGNPIICFDSGVGSAEFVSQTVPFMDINAIVQEIEKLRDNESLRNEIGTNLKIKASEFLLEKQAPKVKKLIEQLAKQS